MIFINGKKLKRTKYANGELDMKNFNDTFKNNPIKHGSVVKISWYYRSDADLITLMFIKRHLDSMKCLVNLTIKHLPYARMDRVEDSNSPFTLKYLCEFINGLKFEKVIVFEAHSDVSLALLDNVTHVLLNEILIENVMKQVGFDIEKDFVMFPDGGAQKRYSNMKFNTVVGNKVRNFKTGKIQRLDLVGDLTPGSKVIIVDDLSSFGNTFIQSAIKLKESGASEVFLLVAHSENNIFKGKLLTGTEVDKVFTTNSILTAHKKEYKKVFNKDRLQVYNI